MERRGAPDRQLPTRFCVFACTHASLAVARRAHRFIEISKEYQDRRRILLNLSRQSSGGGGSVDDTISSEAFLSYRGATETLRAAMTVRGQRSPPRKGHADAFEGSVEERARAGEDDLDDLLATMQQQWVEVECLLRVRLDTEEALAEARSRTHAALDFDAALNKLCKASGVLKGAVFQALLAHADGMNEPTPEKLGLGVEAREWASLTTGADGLRKLVRIKVQDDNDLKAANGALGSCDAFFGNLRVYSRRTGVSEMSIITKELRF